MGDLVKAKSTPTLPKCGENDLVAKETRVSYDGGPPSTVQSYPKINLYEQADRTFLLDAGHSRLHQITKPAMLLRDVLVASVARMYRNGVIRISEGQVEHFQMLFDFVVASAHAASAETILKRYDKGLSTRSICQFRSAVSQKDATIRYESFGFDKTFAEVPTIYLEENVLSVDAAPGPVRGRILSSRSPTHSSTLAFAFEYLGHPSQELTPFAIYYMSHELQLGLSKRAVRFLTERSFVLTCSEVIATG
jgi:hypothetical protein